MNSLNETVNLENEVQTLNERLKMYKSLNGDLSTRINQLKVEVNSKTNELTNVRRELLDERAKTAEMKRFINSMHRTFEGFFSTYIANVQEAADNGIELDISTPGGGNDEDKDETLAQPNIDPALKSLDKTVSAIKDRLQGNRTRTNALPQLSSPNALNTIIEESQCPLMTSTPFVLRTEKENDENFFEKSRAKRRSSRNSSSILIDTPARRTPQRESNTKKPSTNGKYTIYEDDSSIDDQMEMEPCFVRLSRCALLERKLANVNEQTHEEPSQEKKRERSKASSEEPPEIAQRPKRSKRPLPDTLKEPSTRSKLRRQ